MSLTKKFLYNPKLDSSEPSEDSDKLFKGGVRGKRILIGIIILSFMYLLAIGNLIALIIVSASLHLNSFGSLYFSFVNEDTLRLHSTVSVERLLLEGDIHSDSAMSLSSLNRILLNAGAVISDDVGIVSSPTFLSMTGDAILSSTLTFRIYVTRANSSNLQMESLSNYVSFHSRVRARKLNVTSGIQVQTLNLTNATNGTNFISKGVNTITGDSGVRVEGSRGVKVSGRLVSASYNAANFISPRMNISAPNMFIISTAESMDNGTSTPQLRLCACNTGALFLLNSSPDSCRMRGPVSNLC